jgi:anti-anti-sigma regulatory factor
MDLIKTREYDDLIILDLPAYVEKSGQDMRIKAKLMETALKGKNIGVNMSATARIDSGIVTALLAVEKEVQRFKKKIYIIRPSEQARELFAVTSINRIIPIVNDEKDILP